MKNNSIFLVFLAKIYKFLVQFQRIDMSGKKFVATFICLWIIWLIFTGVIGDVVLGIRYLEFPQTYEQLVSSPVMQQVLVGGIVSLLLSTVTHKFFTKSPGSIFNPVRWGYLIAFIPVYIWEEIKAHLNVAYRILTPSLSIEPSIVKLPTEFESEDDVGITALANSITMTPGTLTVDVDEDEPSLYVHWISAGDRTSPKEAFEGIGRTLEAFLKGGHG